MDVTGETIDLLFKGFNTKFNAFHSQVKTRRMDVAMKTSSTGSEAVYGWLSDLPQIREWLESCSLTPMGALGNVLENRLFESTIRVQRTPIDDDKLGLYDAQLGMMVHSAAMHPDELVFSLPKRYAKKLHHLTLPEMERFPRVK